MAADLGHDLDGERQLTLGAGLLVEITRASVVRILRLEVAYPDRGKGPVLQLTSDSLF